jgi:predicted Na+-dependent transporter
MLNVGLTQRPSEIAAYMRRWRFILRMLIANFVLTPLFMVLVPADYHHSAIQPLEWR